MAYNNGAKKKNNTNGNGRNNARTYPKKLTFAFPIIDAFFVKDHQNGTVEIDRDPILKTLQGLSDDGVFKVLTQNVNIANSVLYNDPNKKGNATVGYIDTVDTEHNLISVTIFGTSVDKIKAISDDLIIDPKIIAYKGEFKCFNGFNLIPASLFGASES